MSHKGDLVRAGLPLTPGSVVLAGSLLMRTRFNNWVSDGNFLVTDEDLAYDLARGFKPDVIFDAGLTVAARWEAAEALNRLAAAGYILMPAGPLNEALGMVNFGDYPGDVEALIAWIGKQPEPSPSGDGS